MTAVFLSGLILLGIGLIWYLIVAFRTDWRWGVSFILFPPIAPLIFLGKHYQRANVPVRVCLAGIVLAASPAIYTRLVPIDLGEREKMVDGELHLTLTGWDQKDYSVIEKKANVVVLQMANEDVTDETMKYVSAARQLRELDISFSQVGDAGIAVLDELPNLQRLHLQQTRITDEGFQKHLANHPTLTELNLMGTKVSPELIQTWMADKPGRMALF